MPFRRLRKRLDVTLGNIDDAVDSGEEAFLRVTDAFYDILTEGVKFTVSIAGNELPIEIKMVPDDGNDEDV